MYVYSNNLETVKTASVHLDANLKQDNTFSVGIDEAEDIMYLCYTMKDDTLGFWKADLEADKLQVTNVGYYEKTAIFTTFTRLHQEGNH